MSRTATSAEIKAAYRTLAKRYHPDANAAANRGAGGGGAAADTTREFQAINRAYEVLSDAEGRGGYDAALAAGERRRGASGVGSGSGGGGGGRHTSTADFARGGSPAPTGAGGGRRPYQGAAPTTDRFRGPHAASAPPPGAPNRRREGTDDELNGARMRARGHGPTTNDFARNKPSGGGGGGDNRAPGANASRHPFQDASTDQFRRPHVPPPSKNTPDYYRNAINNFNGGGGGVPPPRPPPPAADRSRPTTTAGTPIAPIPPPKPRARAVPPREYAAGHVLGSSARSHARPRDDARTTAATPDGDGSGGRPRSRHPPADDATSPGERGPRSRGDDKPEEAARRSPSAARTIPRVAGRPTPRGPPGDDGPEFPSLAARACATALSALSTRHLHLLGGHSPVLAACATALLASTCLDRRLGRAALCGSLAGMSGGHLAPDLPAAVALAGLASACHEILIVGGAGGDNDARRRRRGVGGRIGAAAFLATSALAKFRGVGCVTAGRRLLLRRGLRRRGGGAGGPSGMLATMVLYHALGAVATILLRLSSDDSAAADPVRASSVVGLLGSLFLVDPAAAMALYGGSFVGMSLPSRLMHGNIVAPGGDDARAVVRPRGLPSLLGSFAGAGALAGLFHAMTIRYGYWNGGWGGKAGLCALAGCWVYRGLVNAVSFLRNKRK